MTIHVHKLEGCAPTPLAHYLKALAILRLLAEQRDPQVRGWWKEEAFWLSTDLSREELLRFFLEQYEPTPILSPWNGGSGFFYDHDPALTAIETSTATRLQPFRDAIVLARQICAPLARAVVQVKAAEDRVKAAGKGDASGAEVLKEARAEKDHVKDALLSECRRTWSGGALRWFDAALALDLTGAPSWPALLGSGGNDGRLDFTNNSMQHLAVLIDCADPDGAPKGAARALLSAALLAQPVPGLSRKAVGQFLPGSAGGDNMSSGFSGEPLVNPWDFILTLEGSVVLASSVVRTADAEALPQAAAPFAVRSSSSGYGSAAGADEGPRGEQWMPMWSRPARNDEVAALFSEGRTRVGKHTSTRALDAARAVARLGAARGVSSFERYGYIERNGQANLAVPLGRWQVASQAHEELLEDIDPWVRRVRAFARDRLAPKAITSAARIVDEAILSVCRSGSESSRWQALLIALGEAEGALLRSPQKTADAVRGLTPLPVLRPAWIQAADDGSPELRLAIALASQDVALAHDGREVAVNVRAHWMPLDRAHAARHAHAKRAAPRFAKDASGLANDPDVVCVNEDLERDCIALMRRRVQMAVKLPGRGVGLVGARGAEATLADVMRFVRGDIDDARVAGLARALMAIAWWAPDRPRMDSPPPDGPDAAYAIARIAHLAEPLNRGEQVRITIDPESIARLVAGDLAGAMGVCMRRLRASGIMPLVHVLVGSGRYSRRLAASLAFPISATDVRRCAELIAKPDLTKETSDAR
jgi:CRISPR-associated protein Csx17